TVYVYDLASASPDLPIATLPNPSPDEQDYFGISVAVYGTRIAVGAESDDGIDYDTGSAYVFDLTSATPSVPVLTLTHPTPKLGDMFGTSVAMFGDLLAIGANRDDHGTEDAGAVFAYDFARATPTLPILMI